MYQSTPPHPRTHPNPPNSPTPIAAGGLCGRVWGGATNRGRLMVALSAAVALSVTTAEAQARRGAKAQAAQAERALTRVTSTRQDWTVHAEVRIFSGRPHPGDASYAIPTVSFQLSQVDVAYPLIPDTASSEAQTGRFKGSLWVGANKVSEKPTISDGYQGLSSIAVWSAEGIRSRDITLKVDIASVCYETRIDERIARGYTWPDHPWGKELALCLEPQLFVQPGDEAVAALARRWTNGGKPRDARPYDLAKLLATRTLEHVRRTQGLYESSNRNPGDVGNTGVVSVNAFLSGFRVNGAAYAARSGEGSPYDLACLLTAIYRASGLPARLVIGLDIERSDEERHPVLRSWVEFFLARDPAQPKDVEEPVAVSAEDGEWIPVDITRQQEFSSRAPPLNQRWQFFGHNEEFDFVAPFSFHWLPPSTLTNAGAAGIWGWLPQPGNPVADQELKFWHLGTPKRGDDPEFRRK